MNKSDLIRKSVNWGGRVKRLNVLLVVALLLSLTPASIASTSVARVQPLLLELAAQQPDQVVSVIVQKTVKDDQVEQAVGALGGHVTKDLHIINAFSAQMKARDVLQLAHADGVRWVSLDAPTVSTASATLNWNTFLGAGGAYQNDYGEAIVVDGNGNIYVAGHSNSTWGSPVRPYSGSGYDAFVARLDSYGNLIWNTFLGGNGGEDQAYGIALDNSGNIYVSGWSAATWGSPTRAFGGGSTDAYVAKLTSSGSLVWNAFLGGNGSEYGYSVAVDSTANVYATGFGTQSWGSPVRAYSGLNDAFAAKLSSNGSLVWNTFLGSSGGDDYGQGIALDISGNVYVVGNSYATWGVPVRTYTSGSSDGFVTKLSNTGALTWSTFLGGGAGDGCYGVAVGPAGNVYVSGYSGGAWGSPVAAFGGTLTNALAARLDSSGNLMWNTFYAGSDRTYGNAIAVDSSGNIDLAGDSGSDAFAATLTNSGSLLWNTTFGGSGTDTGEAVAVDITGGVYVAGTSTATWGTPVRPYGNGYDAFIVKFGSGGSGPAFRNTLAAAPTTVAGGNLITITQMLSSTQVTANVTPSALTVVGTNNVSAFLISGPTPASATVGPAGTTFTWVYQSTTEGSAGQLSFSGTASDGTATWPWASSNSVTVNLPPDPVFTTWATAPGTVVASTFVNSANMVDSALGPLDTYGYGDRVKGSFAGFEPEITPNYAIGKVEVALYAYAVRATTKTIKFQLYLGGSKKAEFKPTGVIFNNVIGASNAGIVYYDITSAKAWTWADFENDLQIVIDQSGVSSGDVIYYDAVGLRVTETWGNDLSGNTPDTSTTPDSTVDPSKQVNVYNSVIGASQLWNTASKLQGKDITVAVVDSGVYKTGDLSGSKLVSVNFNQSYHDSKDRYGHGTFVAGIIVGNGQKSNGKIIGVAPKARILNVRVSDDQGMSTESDVVAGLQWIYDNRARYNIRLVNLSLNSSVAQSYHTSPLDAACEVLWFNGIVVVTSAGNNGTTTLLPPANDPFVITVGATDDKGTTSLTDDVVAAFSAYGTTESGLAKPDLVAPGRNIIAFMPGNKGLTISRQHAANKIDDNYFKMSGTSMSAPMVTGAVALLLQDEPNLNPDQVKYRLMATANKSWPGYTATKAGAGYLDVYAAVNGTSTQTANTGLTASQLLWTGSAPPVWDSVQWGSVQWGSVQWGSVQWGSVQWGSVQWGSDYWGP